ncbi:hypothetical protein [Paenibacillus sp. 481]|uniref:hypothetical protein n=1 Tax=Paenibacillus sp. 481 TaxID=2835869 RepID=UPI001E442CBB|nr:hypothetical protein [Paenibacillus sp. 481]UHA73693.1 hypothetical protein KIK04_00500 [Paenibacillus sp. 481]
MMFSFPVILVYGVLTSMLSDYIGKRVAMKWKKKNAELFVSAALHLVFGLVLLWVSLIAALLFLITDILLRRKKTHYSSLSALISLGLPVFVWTFCLGILWINEKFW